MYDHMLEKYRIIFEGLPEPVFYGGFYPIGCETEEHWTMLHYAQGLKSDKDPDRRDFNQFAEKYGRDLRDLLNCVLSDTPGQKRGAVVIPSSTKGLRNRVTELVDETLRSNSRPFANLTGNLQRSRSKTAAHQGGSRSFKDNMKTLTFTQRGVLSGLDAIVAIDDITTTGTSFRTVDAVLREAGFKGQLFNFAFARTMPGVCVEAYAKGAAAGRRSGTANGKLNALVIDFDQTLVADDVRDPDYEDCLWRAQGGLGTDATESPYQVYRGVEELMGIGIPFAIVSNRPEKELVGLLSKRAIANPVFADYPYSEANAGDVAAALRRKGYFGHERTVRHNGLPHNVFPFPKTEGKYPTRYYKPHPRGVREAADWISREFFGGSEDIGLVGIGNTPEDLIAYRLAGIRSALALWGVPDYCREHAARSWGADLVFGSPSEFAQWCRNTYGPESLPDYYGMGVEIEPTDSLRAIDYYQAAIQSGANVSEAARRLASLVKDADPTRAAELLELAISAGDRLNATFELARMLAPENPERAKELYEVSLEAGDKYASANNLALLIAEDDPERAARLYETSIDEGNTVVAARNLARLIRDEDPNRAVGLFKMAYEADDGWNLAPDLEPLIRNGVESAVSLYEEKIVGKNGQLANNLAQMLAATDPAKAEELYQRAIAAGDKRYATNGLANLICKDDRNRAITLYRRAIAAGDERYAPNGLAMCIMGDDPETAKSLFLKAIAGGDEYYAPVNLARLVEEEDPSWAVELLDKAATAGRGDLAADLERLVQKRTPGAVDLYKSAIVAKDKKKANDLGVLVQEFDPAEAKRLFQLAIDAGDERYATGNLAFRIMGDDPERAMALFDRAIAAGETRYATNNLGTLIAKSDLDRAVALFEQAIESGDSQCAPCNLAHVCTATDPDHAVELYEMSLEHYDETEAMIGLAYLLAETQPERSAELLERARDAANRTPSIHFYLEILGCADRIEASRAARFLAQAGFDEAQDALVSAALGDRFSETDRSISFGRFGEDEEPIEWIIVERGVDDLLLLSKRVLDKRPLCVGGVSADWENSELRSWLSGEFAETAFGGEDIGKLAAHESTGDLVFCLSASEIDKLALDQAAVLACKDAVAAAPSKWWLRPEDGGTMSAPCITENGSKSWSLALLELGVRPAIRVSLGGAAVGKGVRE